MPGLKSCKETVVTFVTDVVVRSRTRIRRNSAQAGLLLSPLFDSSHSLSLFLHTHQCWGYYQRSYGRRQIFRSKVPVCQGWEVDFRVWLNECGTEWGWRVGPHPLDSLQSSHSSDSSCSEKSRCLHFSPEKLGHCHESRKSLWQPSVSCISALDWSSGSGWVLV